MRILVTGCAGFIGYHLCEALLNNKKMKVFGIDNLNDYYDINLKKNRLSSLKLNKNFIFNRVDIANEKKLKDNFCKNKYNIVVNLAAQAGVRYSIEKPEIYQKSNVNGFFNILENCKNFKIKHLIHASTSSVYGDNKNFPLEEDFNTDKPLSFYAATKKSNEVMAYAYSNIYKLPVTILRFFTVYGPKGRPDMSLYKFTNAIINNKPVKLFNNGNHIRDFTYISDVINAIEKVIFSKVENKIPYQIYNVSSNNPKSLKRFLNEIEKNCNKISKKVYLKLQKGDVHKTHGSNILISKKLGFKPSVNIEKGIFNFVKWFNNNKLK
tara:strand:+ start:132 stop:1100 length:969 start_codon:yes stop_codon:yes gene_type:complete